MDNITLSAGLTTATIEFIKWVFRKVVKDPEYEFPKQFYLVSIPLINFLSIPFLAFMGEPGYTMPNDWQSWGLQLGRVITSCFISVLLYEKGVQPLKAYAPRLKNSNLTTK